MENERQVNLSAKLPAIKSGIHYAFIEVYDALHVKVFRFFLKRVVTHDTAKDLTQQCFIRLWEFRHTLSETHPLEMQIFIIARSVLINHIKKEATHKKLRAAHVLSVGQEDYLPDTSGRLEAAGQVNAAIATLPPMRKKIVILKTIHGFTNKEIAQEMKISVKTVEDHVTKAFRQLRQVVTSIFLF
jgi:RNA polymerase sigma factor (sigma-70 family)